ADPDLVPELVPTAAETDDDEVVDSSSESAEKGLSPDAIAKRLEALGGDGESAEDKASRLEEERLIERRAKTKKKGKGKAGLQAAASKRLSDVGTRTAAKKKPRSTGTVSKATDFEGDALLEKTDELAKWAKKNQTVVGIVIIAAAVVGLGFGVSSYFQHKKDTAASTALQAAVADQRGRIGDPAKEDEDEGPKDTTPIFKTPEDRQNAALAKFKDVVTKFPGTGAGYLALLSEGSLLLDKHDAAGAIAAFTEVKGSPLAKVDHEVFGRSLELLGFAYEYQGDSGTLAAYDDAIKTYRELENTDVFGFQELGMYHQARMFQKKGDKAKAEELLKSVMERVNKPGENHPFPYLEILAEDRLRALDPAALPPKKANRMGGGPTGSQMSEAQMRKLIEQMKKQQAAGGGGGGQHQ
ncbi:MAG: hypothetical protein ABI461_23835, partial [Polyangiaceae bacterium]